MNSLLAVRHRCHAFLLSVLRTAALAMVAAHAAGCHVDRAPSDSVNSPLRNDASGDAATDDAGRDDSGVAADMDSGLECVPGERRPCYDGPVGTEDNSPCRPGEQRCDAGTFGSCQGQRLPDVLEECNEIDDDCDGTIDEGPTRGEGATCEPCGGACDEGETCCEERCVDTATDALNCGGCGEICGADSECCEGSCVDQESDVEHCGACGRRCEDGTGCCDGDCVDIQNDAQHCGASCQRCGSRSECCEGTCTDIFTWQNCGGCGQQCEDNELCCVETRSCSSGGVCETTTEE